MIYTCLCEDEYYKENCSQECDLCSYGHTEDESCTCYRCEVELAELNRLEGESS